MAHFTPTPSTFGLLDLAMRKAVQPKRILDLCCGNGWLAKSLSRLFPNAEVWASDIRDDEFTYDDKIHWNKGDLFENLSGMFDLIICNPPYCTTKTVDLMKCEPRVAYDGGEDGFDLIQRILTQINDYLTDNGVIALEIGDFHAEKMTGFELYKDSHGWERYALGRKREWQK